MPQKSKKKTTAFYKTKTASTSLKERRKAGRFKMFQKALYTGKMKRVMREFKYGALRSSTGQKVTSRKQAIAIAISEANRYAGLK